MGWDEELFGVVLSSSLVDDLTDEMNKFLEMLCSAHTGHRKRRDGGPGWGGALVSTWI